MSYGEHRKAVRQFYVLIAILPGGVFGKAAWDAHVRAPERTFTYHAPERLYPDLAAKQAWPWTGGRDSVPVETPSPPRGGGTNPSGNALELPAALLAAPRACPIAGAACRVPRDSDLLVDADRPGRRLLDESWLPGHSHRGIDLPGDGYRVNAVWDGVVDHVVEDSTGSSGLMVVIRSNIGGVVLYHKYMHLASIAPGLRPGVPVTVGQKIGVSGSSGVKKSAAHLHFEVRGEREFGAYYDPSPLIN